MIGLYAVGAALITLSVSLKKRSFRIRHPFLFIAGTACIGIAACIQVNQSA